MPNLPYRTHIAYYLGRKRDNQETSLLDRIVCFFTRSRFSHVELIYSYDPEHKSGACVSSSPRDGGVRSKIIDFSDGKWEVYEVGTIKTPAQIIEWAQEHDGMLYDWLGALGAYIDPLNGDAKRLFCVEAVGECLGMPNAHKMTPGEFHKFNALMGHKRVI